MQIGDASLKFVADTTELDAAFEQLGADGAAKLAPMQESAAAVGASFDAMAQNAQAAGVAMQAAAEEGTQAASTLSEAQTNVARLTYNNEVAQKSLGQALRAVRATGGDVASVIQTLGQAQARAAQTAMELAAAQREVQASATVMGTAMTEAGEVTEVSMFKAKAEIALLGEEVGVKIPRHLRGFLAELPGVGAALQMAFSATAVLMLLQILVMVAEKLSAFIGDKFVYTEAMKAEYEEQIKINGSLADQVKKLEDLQKAYGFIGLSGTAKIKKEFMDLNDSIRKNELSVNDLENRLTRFRDFMKEGLGLSEASQAEMNRLSGQLLLLTSTIKTQQQEQANLSKEYDHEEAAKAAQHGKEMVAIATAIAEAKLAANKRSADANADLWAATGKLLLAQGQISATLELQMTRDSAQAKYNAELSYQQELLALLEKDPTKNAARIIAQNAGIESLETEHLAKLAEARANFEALQKSIKERIVETIAATVPATVELTEEEKKQLAVVTALEAAYKALGMTGITMYDEMARHAREDYEIVARAAGTGMASQLDWMVAYQKALQADINAKKQAGVATVALQKDLDLLTKSIEKLAGATPKVKTEKLRAEFHDLARTVADGTTTFKTAASVIGEEFAQGIGQAVAAAETGSEGIGKAMEKMAASVLSSISSMCIVQAIYETAMGLGDLANPALEQYAAGHFVAAAEFAAGAVAAGLGAMAMSGGSGGSSGGSSSSSSTATPASGNGISGSAGTAGNNPSQTVNVQRFATGGLVSSPTLAVIGDSINSASEGSREAALPLDDPRAMSAIADAITERMQASGGGGGGDSHFHFPNLKGIVSPDVLDTVIDQVNTRVNGGKRLLASEARRTVRRS